ncbi:hypothetical protein [Spongiibacter sp.]|uniref:hypothetical protein n=1 Tax=Spongiibacter sp. TaxID=2024860 RepID=UPI000C61C40A|nr:hypothetical protein [Spongiibacter sp.]MBU72500.1 hypothetical protein [Spongiibacter sp.]
MIRRPSSAASPLEQVARVTTDSLVPCQQRSSLRLATNADVYLRRCLKYPGRGVFHSYPEYLHGILLDVDPDVTSFVPQPYTLKIARTSYTPDVYVVRTGQQAVIELKGKRGLDPLIEASARAFFADYGIHFSVVSNNTVLAREREALNWLPLLQVLACADQTGLDTQSMTSTLLERCRRFPGTTVEELLSPARRPTQYVEEVALYRLLVTHQLSADLVSAPLNYSSVLTAC